MAAYVLKQTSLRKDPDDLRWMNLSSTNDTFEVIEITVLLQ
jgi:hypothetical protein